MKKRVILLLAVVCMAFAVDAKTRVKSSGTSYAQEALQPYVESGQLAGAISVFYKDGVQEVCCIGYADVEKKRPIKMDNVFMQCSQTKGFCGVTIANLSKRVSFRLMILSQSIFPSSRNCGYRYKIKMVYVY